MVHGRSFGVSLAPNHPRLSVRKSWGEMVKERRMVRVSGISPPIVLGSFNNDINTLEAAVKERVFFVKDNNGNFVPPPLPGVGVFAGRLMATRQALLALLPRSAPLTRLQFVETFRGRKRQLYQAAYDTLLRDSVSVEDSHIKVFVKYEKTNFTAKKNPVPRVISPRTPRYNIEVGRYLRPIEERIFKALGQLFGHVTVFKGMNASKSAQMMYEKWCMFVNPVAIGLDAKRFDQHVSREALSWEHSIYLPCFPQRKHSRQLAGLLQQQLANVCRGYTADGSLKYTTQGGRMSGDMNTSLGNCVLMCSMIHAYALYCGVKVQLANNGDDCVVIMESCDLARFSAGLDQWFTDMGFSMVVEPPCYQFEEIEFCQTHPVYVGPDHDSWLMVRHPRTAIAKDTLSVHAWQSEAMFKGWMHAVGTGGLAMAGRVPILQDFYRSYVIGGKYRKSVVNAQSWGVRQLSIGMVRDYGPVLPATRASFYYAFGVTPDEQLVLESFYSGVEIGMEHRYDVRFQVPMPL